MGKNISVNRSPTPKLNELIKLAIGTRSIRQVEEESGISHGHLGKVLNNTQKASGDLLHKLNIMQLIDYGTEDEIIYHCGASSKDAGNRTTSITTISDKINYSNVIKKLLGNPILLLT